MADRNLMRAVIIKTATASDIPTIKNLAHDIWPVVYRDMISIDQINYMLKMMYSDDSLHRQMFDESCTFLIAFNENCPVGFASYSPLNHGKFKLHKLYVLPTMHGNGIGKKLLITVFKMIVELDGKSIELQVNKNNKAKEFYHAMGFEVEKEMVLDIGGGFMMDDFVMVKKMTKEQQ